MFFLKSKIAESSNCFYCCLGVALSAARDGHICNLYTPAQSKRTFPGSHFFSILLAEAPSSGTHFETNLDPRTRICVKKCVRIVGSKISASPDENGDLCAASGPPDSLPHAHAFQTRSSEWGSCSSNCRDSGCKLRIAIPKVIPKLISWSKIVAHESEIWSISNYDDASCFKESCRD